MKIGIVDDHELVREGLAALLIANSQTKPSFDVVYSGGVVTEAINAQPEIALLDIDLGPNSDPVDRNVELLTNAGIPTLLMSAGLMPNNPVASSHRHRISRSVAP